MNPLIPPPNQVTIPIGVYSQCPPSGHIGPLKTSCSKASPYLAHHLHASQWSNSNRTMHYYSLGTHPTNSRIFQCCPFGCYTQHFPDSADGMAQGLSSGTVVVICDGSYMPICYPHLTAVAWIIHPGPTNLAPPCYSVTQVQGNPSLVNSYRVELQGLHMLLLAIHPICQLHHIQAGLLVIRCDNQGVLHHVLHPCPYTPSLLKHANLIRAIANLCSMSPLHLSFKYVAGHQDNLM